ncbi:MAG: hypothetical protein LBU27_03960 [Candidatus Peribacteria bacterium]|jgi:hypothetical protein|nr:hypothetical protein [Candidatus Peribacteria bacterium]
MKKFLLFLFLSLCTLWSGASVVGVLEIGNNTDHSFPYTGISTPAGDSVGDTDNLPGLLGAETTSNEGLLQKLLNAFGLEGYTDEGVPSAIAYLKVIINLLL